MNQLKISAICYNYLIDPCRESNSPICENGGSCAYSTGRYGYECVCTPGWTGGHCDDGRLFICYIST